MPGATYALRKGIFARLSNDATLAGLLGGARIYDEPPRGEASPCILLSEGTVKDFSSASVRGHEHQMTLSIWSTVPGTREAFEIADAAVSALESMGATLDGHRLINLVALSTEVKREPDRQRVRGTIRLRALTEVL